MNHFQSYEDYGKKTSNMLSTAPLIYANLSSDRTGKPTPSIISFIIEKEVAFSSIKQPSSVYNSVKLGPKTKWHSFEHAYTASN